MMSLALNTYRFNHNGTYIWLFGDEVWESCKLSGQRIISELEIYYEKVSKIYGSCNFIILIFRFQIIS